MNDVIKIYVTPPVPVKLIKPSTLPAIKLIKVGTTIQNSFISDNLTEEIAGETISSGKVVYSSGGKIYNFNPGDVTLYGRSYGISKTSAVINQQLTIQWGGKFSEAGLGLVQDQIYYAGTSGLPTTNITGFLLIQPIGFAIDSDNLMINFTTAILTN